MFFKPGDLKIEEQGRDESIKKEKNRFCTMTFTLPPGSYATILIKALLLA
jgi:tRNA(Glu) U13 pseudouridine synthase TruD